MVTPSAELAYQYTEKQINETLNLSAKWQNIQPEENGYSFSRAGLSII